MLPKANRLPAPDIRLLLRKGKRLHDPMFQLIYHKNNLSVSRFAFIVSTKIDKRATVRNRIKRLLRESVRLLLPNATSGFDVIFIAKTADMGDISQVKPKTEDILKKAGLSIVRGKAEN